MKLEFQNMKVTLSLAFVFAVSVVVVQRLCHACCCSALMIQAFPLRFSSFFLQLYSRFNLVLNRFYSNEFRCMLDINVACVLAVVNKFDRNRKNSGMEFKIQRHIAGVYTNINVCICVCSYIFIQQHIVGQQTRKCAWEQFPELTLFHAQRIYALTK